eukprot:g28625.t1
MEDKERKEINSDIWKNVHITEEVVLDILKFIKVDKFPESDQVYPGMLWEAGEEIAGPLAKIFASSIATSEVPEDWRLANVVPLVKKDGKERPVSLTLVVGKMLEEILRDRIY